MPFKLSQATYIDVALSLRHVLDDCEQNNIEQRENVTTSSLKFKYMREHVQKEGNPNLPHSSVTRHRKVCRREVELLWQFSVRSFHVNISHPSKRLFVWVMSCRGLLNTSMDDSKQRFASACPISLWQQPSAFQCSGTPSHKVEMQNTSQTESSRFFGNSSCEKVSTQGPLRSGLAFKSSIHSFICSQQNILRLKDWFLRILCLK